jgi:hypothetical protein
MTWKSQQTRYAGGTSDWSPVLPLLDEDTPEGRYLKRAVEKADKADGILHPKVRYHFDGYRMAQRSYRKAIEMVQALRDRIAAGEG